MSRAPGCGSSAPTCRLEGPPPPPPCALGPLPQASPGRPLPVGAKRSATRGGGGPLDTVNKKTHNFSTGCSPCAPAEARSSMIFFDFGEGNLEGILRDFHQTHKIKAQLHFGENFEAFFVRNLCLEKKAFVPTSFCRRATLTGCSGPYVYVFVLFPKRCPPLTKHIN